MEEPEELAKKLLALGFTNREIRAKLVASGVNARVANEIVRETTASSTSFFRRSHLWKALSGFALVITVLAIVLLPASGGRAASLGVVGSLTGTLVMFVTFRRGGDKPWAAPAAILLGIFVFITFLGAQPTLQQEENIVGWADEMLACEEAGGYCAETCSGSAESVALCNEGMFCCVKE